MDEKLREAYAELHASVKAMLSWRNGTVKTGLGYIRDTDGSRDQIQLVADALDRIKSLERAQPACPHFCSEGNKAFGCVLPKGHSGDHSAFAQPIAAQGTDVADSEFNDVVGWLRSLDADIQADKLTDWLASHDAALRASVREPLEQALRRVNHLQHQMAIELDPIPQQPRVEYWTRQMEEVICAALAHTEKASQPQTEGKQP